VPHLRQHAMHGVAK